MRYIVEIKYEKKVLKIIKHRHTTQNIEQVTIEQNDKVIVHRFLTSPSW